MVRVLPEILRLVLVAVSNLATATPVVADGANVHGFGRFEFADGFGDQLRDHAGPAARDVTHQSSI